MKLAMLVLNKCNFFVVKRITLIESIKYSKEKALEKL